jgi:hypothetical protein
MRNISVFAVAVLFLATGAAHARAEHYPPPDYSQCTNCRTAQDRKFFACAYHYLMRHRQQDPRFKRSLGVPRSGINWQNPDAASLALEARRACGRGN